MAVALVTGASRGLGEALSTALAKRGWNLVIDGRDAEAVAIAADRLRSAGASSVRALPGDVTDVGHRERLATACDGLELLVNNASTIGLSPQPSLADYPLDVLGQVYAVNTFAPLALAQAVLPQLLDSGGRVINVTSDAAVEPYPGWGGYGSSKAALEQLSAILAAETPRLRVYVFDPGDMRTQMHQEAYPGEDISDRPGPESVVPAMLRLVEGDLPSGRFRASDRSSQVPA